jgi:predicted  nucleic acid-binding Zn-ribbon protein
MATILEPLEHQRSDLSALAELIEKDRPHGLTHESGEILGARRRRLLRNQGMHAELAMALKRDEADVLAMSCQLQAMIARLAEERNAVLARVSPPLRERYEAAIREGQRPALAAVHEGRCPGCGQRLPDASWRLVHESLRVVPCSGCLRLLYDRGWTERDLMPPTLRPVTTAKP